MKQFSIRDLFLVVLIVAIALGWWADRRSRAPLSPARYEIQVVEGRAFVLDTATGQVWERPAGVGQTSPNFFQPKTPAVP